MATKVSRRKTIAIESSSIVQQVIVKQKPEAHQILQFQCLLQHHKENGQTLQLDSSDDLSPVCYRPASDM